jgi:hypothetical protein
VVSDSTISPLVLLASQSRPRLAEKTPNRRIFVVVAGLGCNPSSVAFSQGVLAGGQTPSGASAASPRTGEIRGVAAAPAVPEMRSEVRQRGIRVRGQKYRVKLHDRLRTAIDQGIDRWIANGT